MKRRLDLQKLLVLMPVASIALSLAGCGKFGRDKRGDDDAADNEEAKAASTILTINCGGCHSPGAKHSQFVGNEAQVKLQAKDIARRISSSDPAIVMPPPRHHAPLAPEEKARVLDYLETLMEGA